METATWRVKLCFLSFSFLSAIVIFVVCQLFMRFITLTVFIVINEFNELVRQGMWRGWQKRCTGEGQQVALIESDGVKLGSAFWIYICPESEVQQGPDYLTTHFTASPHWRQFLLHLARCSKRRNIWRRLQNVLRSSGSGACSGKATGSATALPAMAMPSCPFTSSARTRSICIVSAR